MKFRAHAAACALLPALAGWLLVTAPEAAAAAATPSAIGDTSVQWITVSPAYARSGLVVAMGSPLKQCSQNCVHLWVSHNGGASWSQSPARNWAGGRPLIALDGSGREVMLAATGGALQASTNGGADWQTLALNGSTLPAISPSYASSGAVAVANPQGHDYVFSGGASHPVSGSGGSYVDLEFMYAPSAGHFAPALLSAEDGHSQLPVVEQCSASFSCSSPTSLAGSTTFSAPASLLPSTDYANDGTVFAQTGRGIYKSTDGGAAFAPLAIVPSNGASATATPMLALAPGYRESGPVRTAYAAVFQVFTGDPHNAHSGGGVFETNDGGTTWRALGSPSPLDGGVFSVAVAPDGRLFAGYTGESQNNASAGLLCSQDGGASWHATCSPVGASAASTTGAGGAQCATACSGGSQGSAVTAGATPATASPGSVSGSNGASANGVVASSPGGAGGSAMLLGVVTGVVVIGLLAGLYLRGYLRRRAAPTRPPGSPHGSA